MAVIGYDDGADSVTLVALEAITAGEVIYLTNNGWSNSQGKFNGAAPSQGAGNEELLKLTITSDLAIGTVFSTNSSGAGWMWEKSTLIPGQTGGSATFTDLDLDWAGDQIYLFQGLNDNPLLNPTNFIYALHLSSPGYETFTNSTDQYSGDIPPGLSLSSGTAFAQTRTDMHGDGSGEASPWGLNLSSPVISSLQSNTASRGEWLNAIANSDNWSGSAPSISSGSQLAVHTPEPTRVMLVLFGALGILMIRKR